MTPIQLPILTGTTESPAMGSKFGSSDSGAAKDLMATGLFATLKESFAVALAEVSDQPGQLQKISQALHIEQGAWGEEPPDLPEALTALVAFIKSGKESNAVDGKQILFADEDGNTTVSDEAQEMIELALHSPALDGVESDEAQPLLDTAVLNKSDKTLVRWIESMGVTDKQIQTRSLERWLKVQQMPQESKPTPSAHLFKFVMSETHAQGLNLHSSASQLQESPLPIMKQPAVEGKNPLITPAPVPGAEAPSSLQGGAPPALVTSEKLETSAVTSPLPETGFLPEKPKAVGVALALEKVKPQDAEVPSVAPTDPKGTTGGGTDTGTPADRNLPHLYHQILGTDNDENLMPRSKIQGADPPLPSSTATLTDSATEARSATALAPQLATQAENEKPVVYPHNQSSQSDSVSKEHTGERAVTSDANQNMDSATLSKIDPSGRMQGTGMQGKEVQTFLRQHAPEVMTQIVDKAVVNVKNGYNEMKIALKPEFLGQMRMSIITENQQVMIRILTESPMVKEAIETHLHQLKADLGNHGLNIDRIEVFVSSDPHHQPNNRDTQQSHSGDHLNKERRQAKEGHERRSPHDSQQERSGDSQGAIDYFV